MVARQYKIHWKDYDDTYDTWEPMGNVQPKLIRDYELSHDAYDFDYRFRCPTCNFPCSSSRGIDIVIHSSESHGKIKNQNIKRTLADVIVRECECKLVLLDLFIYKCFACCLFIIMHIKT